MKFHHMLLVTMVTIPSSLHQNVEVNGVPELVESIYQNSSNPEKEFSLPHLNSVNQYLMYGNPHTELVETYDFIVVGSGSSGAVIANRLSEIGDWNVLLLEAGEETSFLTDIAPLALLFQFTNYNWNYLMEKQENVCLGLEDQRMSWPRGRALGGSTILNYMMNVRGNREDYDRWADQGNPGWSYKDILKYFVKMEDAHIAQKDNEYHGFGGYLGIQDIPFRTKSAKLFVQAAQEAGLPYVDYNGKCQMGVSYVQATMRRGLRCSSEKAYLRPIRHRKNLKILTMSRVVKVLIDPETKQAYGVQYVRNRKYHIAKVNKEVILSAGVFNSPQLLMLAGIGPKEHLEELGIPVLQDLPVGKRIYDHIVFYGLIFKVNKDIIYHQHLLYSPGNIIQLFLEGQGPMTTLGGVEALAFINTNVSEGIETYPDVELIFLGGGLHTDKGLFYRKGFRITKEIYDAVWKPLEEEYAFQVLASQLHPKSYGYLKLKSSNPYHWPKLYGNYFTDPGNKDIRVLIAAIREVQKLMQSPIMKKYGVEQVKTPIPGCLDHPFDSDNYWECALRHIGLTLYHPTSTCKMGPENDPEAVVDNELRVYGIGRLRVADTSIIPVTLSGHTSTPAYMVGEKASDLIKKEWLQNEHQYLRHTDVRRNPP